MNLVDVVYIAMYALLRLRERLGDRTNDQRTKVYYSR